MTAHISAILRHFERFPRQIRVQTTQQACRDSPYFRDITPFRAFFPVNSAFKQHSKHLVTAHISAILRHSERFPRQTRFQITQQACLVPRQPIIPRYYAIPSVFPVEPAFKQHSKRAVCLDSPNFRDITPFRAFFPVKSAFRQHNKRAVKAHISAILRHSERFSVKFAFKQHSKRAVTAKNSAISRHSEPVFPVKSAFRQHRKRAA